MMPRTSARWFAHFANAKVTLSRNWQIILSNLERGKETAELGIALRILATLSVDLKAFDRQQVEK